MNGYEMMALAEAEEQQYAQEPSPSPPPAPIRVIPNKTTTAKIDLDALLAPLSAEQRKAVVHPMAGGLQILAGPGSGKTRVLTTRVAYLIGLGIDPTHLCVVSFTNKASNELKSRLTAIVGKAIVDSLVIGTFHSICVRFLRKYSDLVGLPRGFTIADRDDCLKTLGNIVSDIVPDADKKFYKAAGVLEIISKLKSKGITPDQYRMSTTERMDPARRAMISDLFDAYQKALLDDNSLDFDDLLTTGVDLLHRHPHIASHFESLLVDEFQDTNSVQYTLATLIAKRCRSVTTVGDPDQSIYGWRSAEVGNLQAMVRDFSPCAQLYLEDNYRSTGSIVGAALAVVREDKDRLQKSMLASHGAGGAVVLNRFDDAQEEAKGICAQIQHIIAHHGGLLKYSDVAVLLRYGGGLSRSLEMALTAAKIPFHLNAGSKFFARVEVKDTLAYLQLIDNPSYTPALIRCLGRVRGVGDKMQKEVVEVSKREKLSAFDLCVRLANGSGLIALNIHQKKGVRDFVKTIRDMRMHAVDTTIPVTKLIDLLLISTKYVEHLKATAGPEWQTRYDNIIELKAYAATIAEDTASMIPVDSSSEISSSQAAISQIDAADDVVITGTSADSTDTLLRTFLAQSMLATDVESAADSEAAAVKGKVTLSTVHSAKGLEWPVVFVPCVEKGVYPFYRCTEAHEIAEERRLLFVAITRAKVFCLLSHAASRRLGAKKEAKQLTAFLDIATKFPTLFVDKLQLISTKTRNEVAKVLGRAVPDEAEVTRCIIAGKQEAARMIAKEEKEEKEAEAAMAKRNTHYAPPLKSQPTPANAGFSSALSIHQAPKASSSSSSSFSSTSNKYSAKSAATPASTSAPASYRSTTMGVPRTTAPASKFGIAETRQSLINDSVLLNPIARPVFSLNTLLVSQESSLAAMRNLGAPSSVPTPPTGTGMLVESTNSGGVGEKRKAEGEGAVGRWRPKRVVKKPVRD